MSVYGVDGAPLETCYSIDETVLNTVYNASGEMIEMGGIPPIEEKRGTSYAFTGMTITDSSNIATTSSDHLRNASSAIKLTHSELSTEQTVSFSCDIDNPTDECVGVWLYTTRRDIGVYGGNDTDGYHIVVKINGTSVMLRGGMYYYRINSSAKITSITVSINSNIKTGGSVYLDSVEVGYHMNKKPIVMFNLDCSPNNFINNAGFDLFAKYGFHATLQYSLTSDCTTGSAAVGYDAVNHRKIVEAGHDYATYSGWYYWNTNVSAVPIYDDESKRSAFEQHAEYLWHINNDVSVYAPSIVHSTGFKVGEVYDETLCDVGFPLIRAENGGGWFTSVDWDDYREIIPRFTWGAFDSGSSTAQGMKDAVFATIQNNACLQIGTHAIMNEDYEPQSGDMNIGVLVMDEVLAYCKEKVDAGELVVCSTAEFLRRCMPRDKYAAWLEQRQRSFVY